MANPYRDWTGAINVAEIDATGTPSSFTALFGDGTWKTASSGGAVHGVGTVGTIAKWSTTNTITDSLITEAGSTVTVGARTIISGALQSSASSLISLSVSGGSTVGTLQAGASTLGSLSIAGGTTLGTLQAGASTVGTLTVGTTSIVMSVNSSGNLFVGGTLTLTEAARFALYTPGIATFDAMGNITSEAGTAGTIAKWSTITSITDSLITEAGSTVTMAARVIISGSLQSSASSVVSLSVSGGSTLGTLQAGNSTLTALSAGASTVASLVVTGALQSSATTLGTLSAGASTLASLVVTGSLQSSATTVVTLSAGASTLTSLVVSNGITAGSGVVAIVDGTGKIPALSATYFASLSAVNLTSLPAANLLIASQAVGDLLYASSASAWARLADVAVNQVLVSGGVGAAPAYSGTPTVTGLTATGVAALTTAAESWVGPSSTAGFYFKSGDAGLGTTAPNIGDPGIGRGLTIYSSAYGGWLEIVSPRADADAVTIATMRFIYDTNSASHKVIAKIAGLSEGTTANQRGGCILFSTKADASTVLSDRMIITSAGHLHLLGSTSGYVGFAPQANAGSTTYTLPTADGTNDQVWTTNGSGGISWTAKAGGGGTGITTLNSQTGATQTFTNDTNITIASAGDNHALGFAGQLAGGRGGTGIDSFGAANRIPYAASTTALTTSANLSFDGTHLGIGINPAINLVDIVGGDNARITFSGGGTQSLNMMTNDVIIRLGRLGTGVAAENDPKVFFYSGGPTRAGTASQSGTTVTGVGTAFDTTMDDHANELIFADGTSTGRVVSVDSATQLTVARSQTVASQGYSTSADWDTALTGVGRAYTEQGGGHLRVRGSILEVATESYAANVHRGLRLRAGSDLDAPNNKWSALIAYDRTNNRLEFGVDNSEITFDEKVRLIIAGADFAVSSTLYTSTDGKTLTTTAPCDRRYKKNVRPANLDVDRIFALRTQAFDWKSSGTADIGFLAEDIQVHLPELYRDGEDGPKINGEPIAAGWKADRFPFYLFEALATLKERVDRVERRL